MSSTITPQEFLGGALPQRDEESEPERTEVVIGGVHYVPQEVVRRWEKTARGATREAFGFAEKARQHDLAVKRLGILDDAVLSEALEDVLRCMIDHAANQKMHLTARAQTAEHERDEMQSLHATACKRASELAGECLAVERERDEWKASHDALKNTLEMISDENGDILGEVTAQRDGWKHNHDAWRMRAETAERELSELKIAAEAMRDAADQACQLDGAPYAKEVAAEVVRALQALATTGAPAVGAFVDVAPWNATHQLTCEADPAAPKSIYELPDFWDYRRSSQGKDPSKCAADLRVALTTSRLEPGSAEALKEAVRLICRGRVHIRQLDDDWVAVLGNHSELGKTATEALRGLIIWLAGQVEP